MKRLLLSCSAYLVTRVAREGLGSSEGAIDKAIISQTSLFGTTYKWNIDGSSTSDSTEMGTYAQVSWSDMPIVPVFLHVSAAIYKVPYRPSIFLCSV